MAITLKINARNDLHLPTDVLRRLNLGEGRILKVEVKGNALVLIPVDLEPRYGSEELEGLSQLHQDEKKKEWIPLETPEDIDRLAR